MNMVELFLRRADIHPSRPAIITAAETVSYGELERASDQLARGFRDQGIEKGDAVLVLWSAGVPLFKILLALFRMGAVALFPDPSAALQSLRHAVHTVPVRGMTAPGKIRALRWFLPFLWPVRSIALSSPAADGPQVGIASITDDHPALITFTSGSTGRPKGIVRSHGFLLNQHAMVAATLQPSDGDVEMISLPVFVLSNLASGVVSVLPNGDLRAPGRIDPAPLLAQIEQHGVTRLVAPPALCQRLVDSGRVVPDLRRVFTGGGPVFPDLLEGLARFAPNAEITAVYGSTEAEPIAHVALHEISEEDLDAMRQGAGLLAGPAVDGVGLRLVDDEILVTGDHVVKGYLDPAQDAGTKVRFEGDIWHRTGDAGRIDGSGRLWLLGRLEGRQGDLYPFSVETAARATPGVCQAAFLHRGDRNIVAVEVSGTVDLENLRRRLETAFGPLEVRRLATIPLDRRHNSKIDYTRLRRLLVRQTRHK